jgi:hypothetical protein
MDLVQRAKNIVLAPNSEWPVIAAEPASTGDLITGYVMPLAIIGAAAGFIGRVIVGQSILFMGTVRVGIVTGLIGACWMFVGAIIGVFVLSFIINALAPTFGGQPNSGQAMKVAVYSYTPTWIAGVLGILPSLGALAALVGGLYALYLLYLGLPALMKNPPDKSVAYTAVIVVCAIVLAVVVGMVGAMFVGAGMMGAGALSTSTLGGGSRSTASSSSVTFDKNSTLGKLQDLGNKLDENNKKVEAAQKAGDTAGAAAAAMGGLGLLMGGGTHAEPLETTVLKPFVPDTFAGLSKTGSSAEKGGLGGLTMSNAKATYSDRANKSVDLEITDTGGAAGLVGLAGWVQGEREDDSGSERTAKENGRLVHERVSKTGGTNEFSIVLGDRFVVKADGHGVDVNQLKSAVASLDLAKLEGMKDVGVQK